MTAEVVATVRGERGLALARFRQNRVAIVGLAVLFLLVVIAVFAGPIGHQNPLTVRPELVSKGPSGQHLLGTDLEGRDVWSRVIHGTRTSLEISVGAVLLSALIGVPLGAIAGFYRGWIDATIMRLTDMVLSFPVIVFLIVMGSVIGKGSGALILLLSLVSWPTMTRLVRGQFLELRESDHVLAAHAVGCRNSRIILRHMLPNSLGVIVVTATFGVAQVILVEASLSFLGLGVQPPTPSWGNILTDAQSVTVLETMPWLWIPPTVLIFVTIMAINFLGDGLRDAVDPRATPT